jgi:transcriptional regulator with XRE-family HTH domain
MNDTLSSHQSALARARQERGWTQSYVAQQVGVSVGAVRRWESGRLPYPATIQKLCDLFALSAQELGLFKEPDTSPAARMQKVDEVERQAAWEIYIELVTRVPLGTLDEDGGIVREALSSLHSLFQTTRTILRQLGPRKMRPDTELTQSCSYLAVSMLNVTLRPFLSKWHPLLKDYEERRPAAAGVLEYEQQWQYYAQFRHEMSVLRKALLDDARSFAQIAGTPSLIINTR